MARCRSGGNAHPDEIIAVQSIRALGAAVHYRQLEVTLAIAHGYQLTRMRIAIRGQHPVDFFSAGQAQVNPGKVGQRAKRQVSGGVAEHVEQEDVCLEAGGGDEWLGQRAAQRVVDRAAQLGKRHTRGQVCAAGGEDIAPVKGAVDFCEPEFGAVEMHQINGVAAAFGGFQQGSDQPIIGQDEKLVTQTRAQRPPRRAHPGVDHGDVHAAGREVGHRPPKGQGCRADILRWDFVGDVGDLRVWDDAPDHPFHRANETILIAKIGGQGNNRHGLRLTFALVRVKRDRLFVIPLPFIG